MFASRFLLHQNWLKGKCDVRTFEGHTQGKYFIRVLILNYSSSVCENHKETFWKVEKPSTSQ